MSSGVAAAARAIISRTAGSAAAISARSSSERARTCSSSASSISVPSKRSPRLSGARRGWSGSMIAAPSSASSAVGREHREGVDALGRPAPRAARRSARRRPAGPGAWRAGSRASAPGAVEALGQPASCCARTASRASGPSPRSSADIRTRPCRLAARTARRAARRPGRRACARAPRARAARPGGLAGALQEAHLAASAPRRRRRARRPACAACRRCSGVGRA